MTSLKLVALDEPDLEVLSVHMQDAILRAQDMAWEPAQNRFVALMNRFDWQQAQEVEAGKKTGPKPYERHRCALRFDHVKRVRLKNIEPGDQKATLSLLAIRFAAGDLPSGEIELIFADNCSIRLNVDCIEAEMSDLGEAWSVRSKPEHGDET